MLLERKAWLLWESNRGERRTVILYTLIQTVHFTDVGPQASLDNVLAAPLFIPLLSDEALPWDWQPKSPAIATSHDAPQPSPDVHTDRDHAGSDFAETSSRAHTA